MILERGSIIAQGTPRELTRSLPERRVRCRTRLNDQQLGRLPGFCQASFDEGTAEILVRDTHAFLQALLAADPTLEDLSVNGASLQDALERSQGWWLLLRAVPTPFAAVLAGKLATAALFSLMIVLSMAWLAAIFAGVRLETSQWLALVGVLIIGAVPFSLLGVARNPAANALEVEGNASKTTAGQWLVKSDARIKTDVAEIGDAVSTLMRLRPVTFRYTEAYRAAHPSVGETRHFNILAQEFAEVFPDTFQRSGEFLPGHAHCAERPDAAGCAGTEILQVDVHPALMTSIAAVQELAVALEQADSAVAEVRTENAELRSELAELRNLVHALLEGARRDEHKRSSRLHLCRSLSGQLKRKDCFCDRPIPARAHSTSRRRNLGLLPLGR